VVPSWAASRALGPPALAPACCLPFAAAGAAACRLLLAPPLLLAAASAAHRTAAACSRDTARRLTAHSANPENSCTRTETKRGENENEQLAENQPIYSLIPLNTNSLDKMITKYKPQDVSNGIAKN